jgi:hypothetical protein
VLPPLLRADTPVANPLQFSLSLVEVSPRSRILRQYGKGPQQPHWGPTQQNAKVNKNTNQQHT